MRAGCGSREAKQAAEPEGTVCVLGGGGRRGVERDEGRGLRRKTSVQGRLPIGYKQLDERCEAPASGQCTSLSSAQPVPSAWQCGTLTHLSRHRGHNPGAQVHSPDQVKSCNLCVPISLKGPNSPQSRQLTSGTF